MGKVKIVLVPQEVDLDSVKDEEGFQPRPFSWEPIVNGEFIPSETRIGVVRAETTGRTCMMSLGQLKKAGLPKEFEEEKWELQYTKKDGYLGRPKS